MENNAPQAEFAFLSACHTVAGDKETRNEVIHSAAGLQFSGLRASWHAVGGRRRCRKPRRQSFLRGYVQGFEGGHHELYGGGLSSKPCYGCREEASTARAENHFHSCQRVAPFRIAFEHLSLVT
ncbi:uncharacterized protein BJ212DRAFT_795302 [Suillus subaureus]|uniref:CHAT domain-containing protein n=1 Tax=Suillus subaureus TaxID=48587 RepID=A0A9P7AMV7_9AGAM|nr:uncharacterized protein BJ212DRAFT_795302 [Suillus subaureus]KAG1792717.1 hypothetical protein BJ212DRAFT_795302 [Suillus subaureus]